MNSILSNLKRRSRSRTKAEFASPSKAKPLDILPGLTETEEEDARPSTSSFASSSSSHTYLSPTYGASRSAGGNNTLGLGARNSRIQDPTERKRDSRRVVLTGAEGLTFDDFFPLYNEPPRPAPQPPTSPSTAGTPQRPVANDPFVTESPLDSINFRFSGLNIPFDFPSSPSTRRSQSPTPSVASSRTTSTTSSSSSVSNRALFTPPTSDDESHVKPHPYSSSSLARAPTYKSQRASVLYMKSMPDLQHAAASRPKPSVRDHVEDDDSDSDDASWFAQELSDIVTLSNTLSESAPALCESSRARPDSVVPLARTAAGRSRFSKPLPVVPRLSIHVTPPCGPSVQLDPTFPVQKKRHTIPSRPPPPPPIRIENPASFTMEEQTDALLALLANAALDTGFLGTGLTGLSEIPPSLPVTPSSMFAIDTPLPPRPPPRMSIPADIGDFLDDDRSPDERSPLSDEREPEFDELVEFDLDSLPSPELDADADWPPTPKSASIYSQASFNLDAIPLEPETPKNADDRFPIIDLDDSPLSPAMPDSPLVSVGMGMYASDAPQRVLRSRWSSSTLSSMVDNSRQTPLSPSSWMQRFNIGSGSPVKRTSKPRSPPSGPSAKSPRSRTPLSPAMQRTVGLERRESSSSRMSDCGSDSGDSTASSGLRRKPIPIEIFMRA